MMSQAYGKLRSFVQLIFRPDCLYHQTTETTDGKEHEAERRQGKEQDQDDSEATPNGTSTQQTSVSPTATLLASSASCAAEDHVVPPHCVGVIRNSSLKTRLLSDSAAPPGAAAAAASSTKQVVQNIYRKPMSRIGSNQSLRRSREPHFRPNNSHRLSRHFQLFDSDPGDIHDYYSPISPPTGNDQPGSQGSSTEDDPSAQGSTNYRRRVYTMPSVPTSRGLGQKFHTRMR